MIYFFIEKFRYKKILKIIGKKFRFRIRIRILNQGRRIRSNANLKFRIRPITNINDNIHLFLNNI